MRAIIAGSLFSIVAAAAYAADAPGPERDVYVKTATGVLWGTFKPDGGAAALILPGSGPTNRDGNGPTIHPDNLKLLAAALASHGITSLRIDKRGIGESATALASEAELRFQNNVDDVLVWIAELKALSGAKCVWLIGHSEGALVAELTAQQSSDVCGLVLIAGAGRKAGDILREQLGPQLPEPVKEQAFAAIAELEAGRDVPAPPPELFALFRPSVQPYLKSWLVLDPAAILATIKQPVLIVQGTNDLQVSVDDAKRLAKARPGAKLVLLAGVNHVFKAAPADRAGNIATYSDPGLPVAPELIDVVARFIAATPGQQSTLPP